MRSKLGRSRGSALLVLSRPVAGAVNADVLRDGLRLLGYTEGQNIAIETHFMGGRFEGIPQLVADFSTAGVAVLVVGGTTPAKMAVQATSTVPMQ